jgi:P27 family predicted phage terminase small subunit
MPDEARAEWDRVMPELVRLNLTKTGDRAALTAYCLAWDRMVAAQKALTDHGSLLGENSQGTVRHPLVAVIEGASKELRAWAHEFGLTPSAEQKVGGQEPGDGEESAFA